MSSWIRRIGAPVCLAMALTGVAFIAHAGGTVSPRQLIEVVEIAGPVVSPDGTMVAFRTERAAIERNTYDSEWYVQAVDGSSPPRSVGDGGVPLRDSAGLSVPPIAAWSDDGKFIYYRASIGGKVDIWRARTDGSSATPVTLDAADVRTFSLDADGSVLRYSVGPTREDVIAAEQEEYDSGIRIDGDVPTSQNLFRSGLVEGRLATQRLGFWFDRTPLLARVPDQWKSIDLGSGMRRALNGPPDDKGGDLPSGAPTPWKVAREESKGRVAILTRVGESEGLASKPEVELWVLNGSGGGRPQRCNDQKCIGKAISDIQWRPGSDEVLFTVSDRRDGYAQSIFRWNVASGVVVPIAGSRGLMNSGERYGRPTSGCGVARSVLVCVTAEADRPPRLERIDIETGDKLVLFDPNLDLARHIALNAPAHLIRWEDASGEVFTGQLFPARSASGEKPPLFVLYYHCFGFLRGAYGDEWPLAALASNGISALCINSAPYRLDAATRFDQGLSAVESVVDMLGSSGSIDPSRVGMGGLSFGTEVTMWTAIHSDVLKAASVTSPLVTHTMYLHGSMREEAFFSGLRMAWQLGSPSETPEQWQRLAAELNIERIEAPILMQMPEQEYLWALDYAIPLLRRRKAELYAFPHEPHFKFQPRHLLAANERNVDWFRYWLLDYEDPDPSKREDYIRWRSMRH